MAHPELFPLGPETVIAMCRRLEARILTFAPELAKRDLENLLGELTMADAAMGRIAARIRISPEWILRNRLDALPPAPELPAPDRIVIPTPRKWRGASKRSRVTYQPVTPVSGRGGFMPQREGWFKSTSSTRAHYHLGTAQSLCRKAFIATLTPEELSSEVPEGEIGCADCARMSERRLDALAGRSR